MSGWMIAAVAGYGAVALFCYGVFLAWWDTDKSLGTGSGRVGAVFLLSLLWPAVLLITLGWEIAKRSEE